MANLSFSVRLRDVDADLDAKTTDSRITTAGDKFDYRRVTATSAGEVQHTFDDDIGNAHLLYLKNTDADNYVQVGFAAGVYNLRLKAGDVNLVSLEPGVSSIFMLADTADCEVEVYIREA